jgi:hypothetical protein
VLALQVFNLAISSGGLPPMEREEWLQNENLIGVDKETTETYVDL